MVTVKEAVKSATQFFAEMFPNAQDVQLEEVDLSDSPPLWNITLSFELPASSTRSALAAVMGNPNRIYKLIEVDTETGEPRSIKIRKI
jgi:hypothetical protein